MHIRLRFLIGHSRTRTKAFLIAFTFVGGLYSVAALVSFIIAPQSLMVFWNKALFPERLTASFLSANTAGTFFSVLAVSTLWLAIQPRQWPVIVSGRLQGSVRAPALLAVATFVVSLICLLQTASRTATFVTAGACAYLLLSEGLSRKWSWKVCVGVVAPVAALSGIILFAVSGGQVVGRLSRVAQESVSRREIYVAHWSVIKSAPLFGYGFGSFVELNRKLISPTTFDSMWSVRALHNVVLQWLEQCGVVGLLVGCG